MDPDRSFQNLGALLGSPYNEHKSNNDNNANNIANTNSDSNKGHRILGSTLRPPCLWKPPDIAGT